MATSATRSPAKTAAPRRPDVSPATPVKVPSDALIAHEEIARRAFEKFAGRGYVHGYNERDWFDAEDELRAEYRDRL